MKRTLKTTLSGVAAIALIAGCEAVPERDTPLANPDAIFTDADLTRTGDAVPVEAVVVPEGQLPEGVTPTAYRVELETDPDAETFMGHVEIDVTLDAPADGIFLHALGPEITSVRATLVSGIDVDGEAEMGLAPGGVTRLRFAETLPAGAHTLHLRYTAPFNLGLAGLYKAASAGTPYLATQMEPIDARRMMPSFDEPRFKTPWTLTVSAPAGNKVIANAPAVTTTDLENGWVRHEFAPTRPIQSYLVALAVGPYDEVIFDAIPANDIRDREVAFRSYAAAGKGEQLREASNTTYDLLRIQEEYFDYPYPYAKLDLIAAPDFAYGAMENAGAIIYRESALLINDRTSLARKRGILTTHAHELAHQWFGNLVTPKWWDDIWLNEAFATWMSYKTMHAFDPEGGFDRQPTVRGIGAMGADSLASARQIRNPINANGDIFSAFDGITYSKGGHVLSMFENYLGENAFREGMRLHMRRFEDGVADVNDFMQSLADGSGNPGVVDSFKSFIFQPGIPYLDVALSCPEGEGASITVSQKRYAPLGSAIDPAATWAVPLAMDVSIDGEVSTMATLMTGETLAIPVAGGCPDWVMPNADGKGYWRFTTSDENWAALTERFDTLSGGEQMVFADNLVAGFRAGDVSAEAMLAALAVTPQAEWDAASIPVGSIASFAGLLEGEAETAMRAWIGDTYTPLYETLQGREDLSQGETLLLATVHRTLINEAEDAGLRAEILEKAKAYVGLTDEAPDASALPPALVSTGIVVGVQDGGAAFFDAALSVAKASDNQRERRTIFNVLASTGKLDQVTALLNDALGEEYQGQEAYFIYRSAIANEAPVQGAAWELFKTNFDALLARIPEIRKPQAASVVGFFCDNAKTDAAEAFFLSNADKVPGYERPLAQGVEAARLCAALKDTKADELAMALGVMDEE